jgi:hypothetical protein
MFFGNTLWFRKEFPDFFSRKNPSQNHINHTTHVDPLDEVFYSFIFSYI